MRTTLEIDDEVLLAAKDIARRKNSTAGAVISVHHRIARDWLHDHINEGWAFCPLTQNACIRIMAQANYPGAQSPALIAARLTDACQTQWHEFWPDRISLLESGLLDWWKILSSRQLTDAYLLALAVQNGGRLIIFGKSVPIAAVPGASSRHLVNL